MANWKDRYNNLRKKAGGVGRGMARGAKDTGKQLAGGAAGTVVSYFAAPHLQKLNVPYVQGAALAVAAHFLRRKYPNLGAGLAGAAGTMLLQEIMSRNPSLAQTLTGAAGPSSQQKAASGYEDGNAGAFGGYYGDAGALQAAGYGEEAGALQTAGYGDEYGVSGFEEG